MAALGAISLGDTRAARLVSHLTALTEKGRVVSTKNEAEIRSAIGALQKVLAQLAAAQPDAAATEAAIEAGRALLEAEMSFDQIRSALRAAVGSGLMQGTYCWIADVYDDWFVYSVEDDQGAAYYRRSYVIDDAGVVTMGDPVQVRAITVYEPVASGMGEARQDDLTTDVVSLVEAALRPDGTTTLKIIAPGWGSSGYYPVDVLKRDGPTVFAQGLHTYWNHPSVSEESDRPERDLNDLAGVLASDARWLDEGPAGPGLYADATVFGPYQGPVNELAPHIGVSIRALGTHAPGEAEGRKGPIVKSLVAAKSVDYVTVAGADGQVLQLFEAARGGRPAATPKEEEGMPDLTRELEEARGKITALEQQITAAATERARDRERLLVQEARAIVTETLAAIQMPAPTRARLAESLLLAPVLTDGELDRAGFVEAIKATAAREIAYLTEATGGGAIRGMGAAEATALTAEQEDAALTEALGRFGLSADAAKIAAVGRN